MREPNYHPIDEWDDDYCDCACHATAVLVNLIGKPWEREQKALEAVLQAEALLSALEAKG